MNSLLFKLHRSYSIPLNLLAKFSWVESEHNASVESNCAQVPPPAPRATAGHLPTLSVPGLAWGISQFCVWSGICLPRAHPLGHTIKPKKSPNR